VNPPEPVIPDPDAPKQDPSERVFEPIDPDKPTQYDADKLDAYDEADADSFPASDPPAATEPGAP
jgi:hypothetical protein